MKVCVVGLGNLGAPLAAVLAAKGHEVTGIDIDAAVVTAIAEGRAPVAEPGIADMLALARPRLGATTDWNQAVAGADASFVIVPTPSEEGGGFSSRHLLEAVGRLGTALRGAGRYHVVNITSTVMPGSCDGPIRTVETYRDTVQLTFARDASLADPAGLFNASLDAGTRRAIDLSEGDTLDDDSFVELVREAVAHNRS